jgi:hypothetical protein
MSIYKKLFELQKEIGAISKNTTNPFFKSKYFDINALLEHVQPLLATHKLLLTQPIIEGKVCTIIYDTEQEADDGIMSAIDLPQISDPQKLGSAITYYRRYTLASLLALQAEDDDGNKTSKPAPKSKGKTYLTPDQYAKVFKLPHDKIRECLKKYDGKGEFDMKEEYRTKLTNLINIQK